MPRTLTALAAVACLAGCASPKPLLGVYSERTAAVGEKCGIGIHGPCAEGLYCRYEPPEIMCRVSHPSGVCVRTPQVCTREYRPVCGCDEKVYSNRCEAAAAGVTVYAEGQCPETYPELKIVPDDSDRR